MPPMAAGVGYAPVAMMGVPAAMAVPGYMPQHAPQMYSTVPAHGKVMPHKIVNPSCHKCHGSGWNSAKGKACSKCVCKKCNGTGWKAHKNKPCKEFKIKH